MTSMPHLARSKGLGIRTKEALMQVEDDFVNHFAADVDPVKAKVMYAVQQPLSASALQEVMGIPA